MPAEKIRAEKAKETQEAEKSQETVEIQEVEGKEQDGEASTTLRNHVLGAMGVGLIPIPIVDLVALTGIQLNLLRKLAAEYDVPFSEDLVKNILGSLIGGSVPVLFARGFFSVLKGIPVIGQTTSALTMPVLAGATTYAVGKVFIQHFASGGTFLTFDPDKVRDFYNEMYKEGQNIASNLNNKKEK
jgi:uncharacterized protein (DUF697 family)